MKKLLVGLMLLTSVTAVCAVEMSRDDYKQELRDKGYLYGCTPVNMSLTEPIRGGFNWAAMHGELDIMELQVKAGLNVKTCGKTLPLYLVSKKQNEAFEFLLKNGYDANGTYNGLSYLIMAEHYKNPKAVEILINNGADVNLETKGYAPLNYAIKKKSPEMVEMLVKAGAKPNEKTKKLLEKTKNEEIKNLIKL